MENTDTLMQETESRLNGFIETFEAERDRLREHRAMLIREREKTDRMLVRVERTIRSLKPEEEKPKARPAQKGKNTVTVSDERIKEAKAFVVTFLEDDNHEHITTRDLREKFPEWKSGVHAVMNKLNAERFLRVAGVGERNIKQYKLTTEAIASLTTEGAHLAVVA